MTKVYSSDGSGGLKTVKVPQIQATVAYTSTDGVLWPTRKQAKDRSIHKILADYLYPANGYGHLRGADIKNLVDNWNSVQEKITELD